MKILPYGTFTSGVLRKLLSGQMPCLFYEFTGLYCPACGGTRACKALLKGDLLSSFLYHPVVLYAAAAALFLLISRLLYRLTRNPRFCPVLKDRYVYIGIGIIAVNFAVKNYMLLVHGIDILKKLPAV